MGTGTGMGSATTAYIECREMSLRLRIRYTVVAVALGGVAAGCRHAPPNPPPPARPDSVEAQWRVMTRRYEQLLRQLLVTKDPTRVTQALLCEEMRLRTRVASLQQADSLFREARARAYGPADQPALRRAEGAVPYGHIFDAGGPVCDTLAREGMLGDTIFPDPMHLHYLRPDSAGSGDSPTASPQGQSRP